MFSFWKSKEGDGANASGKVWLLLIAAAAGILLLLFGSSYEKKNEDTQEESSPSLSEDELIVYQAYLEERVKLLCESIDGVGSVTAVVTLSGSFESVYATDGKGDEYVVIGSGSGASALLLSRAAPSISGVGVVVRSSLSPEKNAELTALLCAAFDIPSNRIHITASGK